MNVNKNNGEKDEVDKDKRDESKIMKNFDAVLKDIKNNGRTTNLTSVRSRGGNIKSTSTDNKITKTQEEWCLKKTMDFMKY